MDAFSYLAVLFSIVLGLGLSHLLAGAARLLRARRRVRPYAPVLLWMAMLFLAHVQIWWAIFETRDAAWTFVSFFATLLIPTVASLLVYLLVPDVPEAGPVDLRASYDENRRPFFAALAALPAVSLLHETLLDGAFPLDLDAAFRLAFVALAVVGFAVRDRRVHLALAALGLVGLVCYVAVLFLRLS